MKPRFLVMSDLHLEYERGRACPGPDLHHVKGLVDLVLLAGDIDLSDRAIGYGAKVQEILQVPVIMIAGNHEFYDACRTRVLEELRIAAHRLNIHFLENEVVEFNIHGQRLRILGATLWTDYKLQGDELQAMSSALNSLNDHQIIYENSRDVFKPMHARKLHHESLAWIKEELSAPYDGKTVVITHHAPSPQSSPTDLRREKITPAYASNLEAMIEKARPALWVHGHAHESFDYLIGETRVVCNPRGYYPKKINQDFQEHLIVEI